MKKLLLLLTLTTTLLFSASFDCKKAKTDIEKLICSDKELSKLDDELNKAYKELLNKTNENDKKMIIQEQRDWIKERDNCAHSSDAYGPFLYCMLDIYSHRIFYLKAVSDKFILTYSEDNKTCDTFVKLLNNNLAKNGDINLSKHKEFNWVKWKQTQGIFGANHNAFISYFDINNDGIDEAVLMYEISHNYLLVDIVYSSKENGQKIDNFTPTQELNRTQLLYKNRLGKVMPEGYGFFDFDSNEVSAFMIMPEPYPININGRYFIAIFGLIEGWSEIDKMPPIYTMPNNGNKVALIKFDPDNSAKGVCILTRANPNTKKYLKYIK
jgi:uncharacterized protein